MNPDSCLIFWPWPYPHFYTRQMKTFKYPISILPHKPHVFEIRRFDYPKDMTIMRQYEAENAKNAS